MPDPTCTKHCEACGWCGTHQVDDITCPSCASTALYLHNRAFTGAQSLAEYQQTLRDA